MQERQTIRKKWIKQIANSEEQRGKQEANNKDENKLKYAKMENKTIKQTLKKTKKRKN